MTLRPHRTALVAALTLLSALASPAPAQTAATAAAPCVTPSEGEIVALSGRWAAALAAGRIDDVANLYADNAVLMAEGQPAPLTGRHAIRTYLETFTTRHPQAHIDMRTVTTRCGLASDMTVTRFQVTGMRKGTRMFVGGRTSTLYAHDGDNWRITQQSLPTMTIPNRAH